MISLYIPQMSYTQQVVDLSSIFFEDRTELTEDEMKEIADDNALPIIKLLKEKLEALDVFTAYFINQEVYQIRLALGVKGRKLFMPVRIAATFHMHGPQLAETMELMGRDKVMANIDRVLALIEK
ncbi:hypothetical protein [Lacticaseibacillus manihotivorans]